MRIAYVVSFYYPRVGGVETHVRRLAQGCAEAGDKVTVLTHQVDGSPAEELADGVQVRRFPLTVSSHTYPLSVPLFRNLRSHLADFDVVHVHSYHTLVGQAAHGIRVPVIFTPHYHGTGHTPLRAFLHRLYRPAGARVFRAADAVICVSEPERDLVIKDFPGVAGKLVTIPNGTDAKLLRSCVGLPVLDKPVVLTVGRLERYKNVDLIIDAFRALPHAALLVVVGDGPDRARLQHKAEAAGSGWPVLFTGRIQDTELDRWFAVASVLISASDHEAFGMTLADGLVSGARVVASAIPAHAALARLAGAGAPVVLVDPRDTKLFASMLAGAVSAGRIPPGSFKLPTWAEVVADTRDLYSQVRLQRHMADRKGA